MDEQQVPEKPVAPQSAGDQLRAAREAAGMSRSDVAAKTRVAERHLEAIEGNRFADLAAPTYAVGFSRAYARAVGLDENDAVANATTFTQKERVGYPVGFDPAGTAATAYGVNALPQTFFLNARHQVVDRVFGAVTLADLHKGIALATAKS